MNQSYYQFLGLIYKARKLAFGENVERLIKKRKVFLVILTEDISSKQQQYYQNLALRNNIEIKVYGQTQQLSHAIAIKNCKVIAVSDFNLAMKLKSLIN